MLRVSAGTTTTAAKNRVGAALSARLGRASAELKCQKMTEKQGADTARKLAEAANKVKAEKKQKKTDAAKRAGKKSDTK